MSRPILGYIMTSDTPLVDTGFNIKQNYEANGNYLKFEFKADFISGYLFGTDRANQDIDTPWFSCEYYFNNEEYLNVGESTLICYGNYNSNSGKNTTTFVYDDGVLTTYVDGVQVSTNQFSGDLPDYSLCFFNSSGGEVKFYNFKIYGADDVLLRDFYAHNNNGGCVYEDVTSTYLYKTAGTITYTGLDWDSFTQLDYITTTGNTYLNLGTSTSADMTITLEDVNFPDMTDHQWQTIIGQGDSNFRLQHTGRLQWGVVHNNFFAASANSIGIVGNIVIDPSGMTYNGVFTPYEDKRKSFITGDNLHLFANTSNGSNVVYSTGSIGKITVEKGGEITNEFIPAIYDGDFGYFDNAIKTFIAPTTGTLSGGTYRCIIAEPSSIEFESSGGTATFDVVAQTGWTIDTPTNFTLSTISGASGTTTVTVTASQNTGDNIEEVLTITDDDDYTTEITISQKKEQTGGWSSINVGDYNVENLYVGGLSVEAMYMGTIQVYSNGG